MEHIVARKSTGNESAETSTEVSVEAVPAQDTPPTPEVRQRGAARLSPDQRAQIVAALDRGESGSALAERFGVSLGAIYSYRRKLTASTEPQPRAESELRGRLVNFAVRTLLGQSVADAERNSLEHGVREEMLKRLVAGI